LINVDVMKQWFWFIAAGAIITVELTVISITLACVFALFGSLGRLSKKMSFRQAWDRYQSREYMVRMVLGRIPYWLATFYTSLFRGTPLLLQIFVIYQGAPEVIKAFGLPESYNPPAFWAGVAALSLNYGAYLTELIKDTSLVSVITVEELLRRSQLAGSASLNNFSTLLVAAAFYWALTIFFSFWQAKLETRMARDKAREKEMR
ncbi:MAG: ABC transporter permease subunit, partial [Actinobacteria bacterium]|nr:ABC transporter permease subunit [Actinomycetota bacterium]